MDNLFDKVTERAGKTIRHWWLFMITGILAIIAGIVVFCNPLDSYLALSLMFGILMVVYGIAELVISSTSRNYFTSRGYSIVNGILNLLLGIFLCCWPRVTLVALPVILGVWKGAGWVIACGVILLLLSLGITLYPLTIGTAAVIVLTGTVLILFGALTIALSLRLRRIHEHFRFHDAEVIE